MITLPSASEDALAVSQRLVHTIQAEIRGHGNWIPFSRYMELALYAPGLGYYSAGSRKIGAEGDFTTAPEMSALFGRTLARQLAELLPQTDRVIYEFGAGTGQLAIDILLELQALDTLPDHYLIIDLSPELMERQRYQLSQALPKLAKRVQWLNQLPEQLDGIIIGNEVLDSMPCERIHWTPAARQLGVALEGERFVWMDRAIDDPQLLMMTRAMQTPPGDYLSEISLTNIRFIHTMAKKLTRGALLLIDYGFSAAEYYHPQREMGTLMGHYRHRTVADPFYLPGLMDLTCHVNFSAVAEAGVNAGLDLVGYTTQAQFLINSGIIELLEELEPVDALVYLPQAAAAHKLLSPAEMGDLFKVIGFAKGISIDWRGFLNGDRCHTL